MKGFPTSYKDETYNQLDTSTEKRLGLPAGSVSSLRLFGEKSNADQVSSVGARTPYQFTPSTRKLIINKYGVDPYLSPENASEAAGLLMKESLDRNNGDIEQAIGEYHGGTNRKAWGPVNKAYRARVMSGMQNNPSLFASDQAPQINETETASAAPDDLDALYAFAKSDIPQDEAPQSKQPAQNSAIPKEDLDALYAFAGQDENKNIGEMPVADTRGMLEKGVDALKESVTGNERRVESTEALPDWTEMPELGFSGLVNTPKQSLLAGTGTFFSGGDEAAKILQSQFPDMQVSQDEKGNYLFVSPTDGKTYAYKPGLRASDIPRAVGQTLAYTAGAPETVAGRALLSAGVQGGIETAEKAAGGTFDADQVALAAAAVPAIELPMKVVGKTAKAVAGKIFGGADGAVADDAASAVAAAPESPKAAMAAADEAGIVAPAVADEVAVQPAAMTDEEFSDLVKKAKAGGFGANQTKQELAKAIALNPDLLTASKRLGIDLPTDLLSDSRQFAETMAAGRGIQASPESTAWNAARVKINDQLEATLKAMDASTDLSVVSQKVKDNLDSAMTAARNESRKLYKEIDSASPKSTPAVVDETRNALQKTIDEMGSVDRLNASEKRLWDMVNDPTTTLAAMNREREEIGAAIGGRQSAYVPQGQSRSDLSSLKRIYGAMADDKYQTVLKVGGEEQAGKLLAANKLNTTASKIEKRIIEGFSKEGEGSIVSRLKTAITTGKGGDITSLNKVLKVLPPENRKEVLMSGLMALSSKNGHFSVGAFEDIYRGLRNNSQVYAKFAEHLSPAEQTFLRDMYLISKRVNARERLISKTGKANQPLIQALSSGNLIQRLAESNGGQFAAKATSPFTFGTISPNAIVEKIAKTPNDRLLAVTKFLNSDEFAALASKEAGSNAEKTAINRVASSKAFANLAKKMGVSRDFSEKQKFISGMLQALAQEESGDNQ